MKTYIFESEMAAEQFNLLRIIHNTFYPAYFERNGFFYRIEIHHTEK